MCVQHLAQDEFPPFSEKPFLLYHLRVGDLLGFISTSGCSFDFYQACNPAVIHLSLYGANTY